MDDETPEVVAARRLIETLARKNGHVREETWNKMDAEMREEVQGANRNLVEQLGSSVTFLARELYSKDVRFVFELLQNADDNHYTDLTGDAVPEVAFSLFNDRVIVDCNEDGFTERNLRAICAINKSSKNGQQGHGYTGEKGVGFKSVFKVAYQVHIQSGHYSFTFTHNDGDNGIGMISPEWKEPVGTLAGYTTRMTLFLINDKKRTDRYEAIKAQLTELKSDMLLFLRKLRRIRIHIYEEEDGLLRNQSSTTLTATMDGNGHVATVQRSDSKGSMPVEEMETPYYVTKYTATGLAKSENRTYSDDEKSSQSWSTSEVVLAFPLTKDTTPLLQTQQIFAFLPLDYFGFNFLIQADFTTLSNREGVLKDSRRNLDLIEMIAQAFIKAIHEMYNHPTLRYQWMRYIQNFKTNPWVEPWNKLVDRIVSKLSTAAILEPRVEGQPQPISSFLRLTPDHNDEHGESLFPDHPGPLQTYLSRQYDWRDLDILGNYGLKYMDHTTWLGYVARDLDLPVADSRLKSPRTSDDWHTRTAAGLNLPWVKGASNKAFYNGQAITRGLAILPLRGDETRWVNSTTTPIYFPETDTGVDIPNHVTALNVLDAHACKNNGRLELYTNLGAKHANAEQVRSAIFQTYQAPGFRMGSTKSYSFLKCLYEMHSDQSVALYRDMFVYMENVDFLKKPSRDDVYLTIDTPNSLWKLYLQGADPWLKENIHFLSKTHMQNPHPTSVCSDLTWLEWLKHVGMRDQPRLVTPDGSSLSRLCFHIAEKHPSSFLQIFKDAWPAAKALFTRKRDILQAMANIKVRCLGSGRMVPLHQTYLPLAKLQSKCTEIISDGFFPFLDLGETELGSAGTWNFLSQHFQVRSQDGVSFCIDMLRWIKDDWGDGPAYDPARLAKVYMWLQNRYSEDSDRSECQRIILGQLKDNLIYTPKLFLDDTNWITANQCLLNAPADLEHACPLIAHYEEILSSEDLASLEHFLNRTVLIESFAWEHIIKELVFLRGESRGSLDKILSYYKMLRDEPNEAPGNEDLVASLRQSFQDKSLVFVPDENGYGSWVKPSDSLWSTAAEIHGKAMLNHHYDDDMEHFFVNILGVSRLTVDMMYDELAQVDPAKQTVQEVKDSLKTFNALFDADKPKGQAATLIKKPILPVRYADGSVKLLSAEVQFAIVDRHPLEDHFRDQIKMLDFSLNEVHQLRPMLDWMNLLDRCLSKNVREHITVDPEPTYSLRDQTKQVRKKAHALTRVAVHLKSPYTQTPQDTQAFFDRLHTSDTLESDSIYSVLSISQDGQPFTGNQQKADVCINDRDGLMKIYVPRDAVSQDFCFASALPIELVRYMITGPSTRDVNGTVFQTVTGILGAKSKEVARRILEANGIVDIDLADYPEEEIQRVSQHAEAGEAQHAEEEEEGQQESKNPEGDTPPLAQRRDGVTQQVSEQTITTSFGALPIRSRPISVHTGRDSSSPALNTPHSSISPPAHTASYALGTSRAGTVVSELDSIAADLYGGDYDEDSEDLVNVERYLSHRSATPQILHQPVLLYPILLEHVIRAAQHCGLPHCGSKSDSLVTADPAALNALPSGMNGSPGAWLMDECLTSFERHCKIGAAGELFVYELLKSTLVGFDQTCWPSTMRRFVSGPGGHNAYRDMGPWVGGQIETSDIVYEDINGQLIELLVAKGYLDGNRWSVRKGVRCYVEVKSTFEECETPFFMSDRQYNLMTELMTDSSIYMVIRVSSLDSRTIGARIYVDPDRLRREGSLQFSTKKWKVTPGPMS